MFELRCGMRSRLAPLLAFLLIGCATTRDRDGSRALEYGCSDLVVIGRVATSSIAEHPSADPNDPLPGWLSEYGLQVHIKRVIRGSEQRATVPATGVAHGQIRSDRDFLVVLSPVNGNGYTLRTAALTSYRPKLSEPCIRD
jgi:hypothetical protein